MEPELWGRVRPLLEEARELPPEDRAGWLAERCGTPCEREVRVEVERLLALDGRRGVADELLREAPVAPEVSVSAPLVPLSTGARIGSYRVERLLGGGGMGLVYAAVQDAPRRSVALKVMSSGLASAASLERFRHEADVLARLRHPGIAQIYEASTHREDEAAVPVPFIAMELVEGATSILEFARREGLGARQRVELFTRIADAVQHGHQKGVIHRDLKPQNLLVDGAGAVKVIDFGVARVLDGGAGLTQDGQVLGTLAYMSPEQVRGEVDSIDVRSDVYSLGLVLHELLAGAPPFDLAGRTLPQVARIASERPPPRLGGIDAALGGDLEWVVAQALAKQPDERYAGAGELAADLRRHLAGEPVSAGPSTASYRLAKLVHRHRLAFGAAALVILAVVGFGVTSNVLYWRARTEGERARSARDFLFDALRTMTPEHGRAEGRVADLLALASAELERAFPDDPLTEAELRELIAVTHLRLGNGDDAEREALAAAEVFRSLGRPGEVRARAALEVVVQARLSNGRAAEAVGLCEELLEARRADLGERDPATVESLARLGNAVLLCGVDPRRAETLLGRALELSSGLFEPSSRQVLTWRSHLALARSDLGVEGALDELARAHAEQVERFGAGDADALVSAFNLADALATRRRTAEAARILEDVVDALGDALGEGHPHAVRAVSALGSYLLELGELERADEHLTAALAAQSEHLGEGHPATLQTRTVRAELLAAEGRADEALADLDRVLELHRVSAGEDTPSSLLVLHQMASLHRAAGRWSDASRLLEETLAGQERLLGPDHVDAVVTLGNLGEVLLHAGRIDEAVERATRSVESGERVFERDDPRLAVFRMTLGRCLGRAGREDEAEEVLLRAHGDLSAALSEEHPWARAAAAALVELYEARGDAHLALPYRESGGRQRGGAPR